MDDIKKQNKKRLAIVGMVVCVCNLSTLEIEAGGSGTEQSTQATQQVQDQSGSIRSGLSK